MKIRTVLAGLALGLALSPALAAGPTQPQPAVIGAADVKSHVGQTLTIEGAVSEIHRSRSGRQILINMNGRYPNNALTAVIFQNDFAKFANIESFNGKTVQVTGAIKLYRGKPEIVLSDPSQIKLKARAA
jgi:DNA/RNA endonuclease YhcR with UshA esterase domain